MKLRNYLIVLVGCLLIACATNESEVNKDLLELQSFKTNELADSKTERSTDYTTAQLKDIFHKYDRAINTLSAELVILQTKHNSFEVATNNKIIDLQSQIDSLTNTEEPIIVDPEPVVLSYPPSEVGEYPDTKPYQSPTSFPGLLKPFNVDVNNLQVTRISDKNMSSNPAGYQMRHDYSKDQCWNADGSEIMLSAYQGKAQILDGNTYEFKRWASNIPSRNRWSYTNPDLIYGVSGNRLISVHATTGLITTLHTFTEYASIELGLGEGNQSNDDRYWAIIGKNNGWANSDFITYDLQEDRVLGTLAQGDLSGIIDWVSMTQNGEYFVVRYNPYGKGAKQGIKRWTRDFSEELHLWDNPQHGDIGIAVNGNPVWITIGSGVGYYLHMTDMVTGKTTGLIWRESYGIEGAHVSCRNVNRAGWAYISVEPPLSNANRHRMTREMFAVKLDNSGTFERWGFHNATSRVYWQQPHVTPNHDGTKIMFASSWGSTSIDSDDYAPTFVTELK